MTSPISQRQEILRLLEAGSNVEQDTRAEQDELITPQQIRLKLKQLSTRYTDKHPEIRRLKKQLKDLESQIPENFVDEGAADRQNEPVTIDPQLQEFHQQLTSIQFNLKRLEQERLTLEQQIRKYENWISIAPVREAEWSKLTRDYQQLNEHYQELVRQNLQAESKSHENGHYHDFFEFRFNRFFRKMGLVDNVKLAAFHSLFQAQG